MTSLKDELTVDDLIVEYMLYKMGNGYEPSFLTSEFLHFLQYFESKQKVGDSLYDGKQLFERFFARKAEKDWYKIVDWHTLDRAFIPRMDMIYSEKDNDFLIKANYQFTYENTYFKKHGKKEEIKNIIQEFLKNKPKRKIDESIKVDDDESAIGKYYAVEIIKQIWDCYVRGLIEIHQWPEQCRDINKFLLEIDLAPIIGLVSPKSNFLELYQVISRRIAILYHQDKKLKISQSGMPLAEANYKLLISGYEKMFNIAFGDYKKSLSIDLEKMTFRETHEVAGFYDWWDDTDTVTNTISVGSEQSLKLVRSLDGNQN